MSFEHSRACAGGICVDDTFGVFGANRLDPDPPNPQPHTARKLYEMYDATRRAYNKAITNFRKSGQNNPNFWDYVNPDVTKQFGIDLGARPSDIMYLHGWVTLKGTNYLAHSFI